MQTHKLRFVIKRIDVAHLAAQADMDRPSRLNRQMRRQVGGVSRDGAARSERSPSIRLARAALDRPLPTHDRNSRRDDPVRQPASNSRAAIFCQST